MVSKKNKLQTLKVHGTHCASCLLIIKQRLTEQKEVKQVQSFKNLNKIQITYHNSFLSLDKINYLFRDEGYSFTDFKDSKTTTDDTKGINKDNLIYYIKLISGVSLIFIIFYLFERSSIGGLIQADSSTPLLIFIPFGVIASLSTCFALVSSLILTISKNSTNIKPHLIFHLGRILTFTLIGGLLGAIGSLISISIEFMATITIVISLFIILLGLQNLGLEPIKFLDTAIYEKLQKKTLSKNKSQFSNFLMGAITILLPCGFTMTAFGISILSKDFVRGALVLFFFSAGTLPVLLAIGLISHKLFNRIKFRKYLQELIGIVIVIIGLFTINSQFIILGLPNLNNLEKLELFTNKKQLSNPIGDEYPEITNGYQILKMEASAYSYTPNYFKVRKDVPVRWQIEDKGMSGCSNAIIAPTLFEDRFNLQRNGTSVKEFLPTKTGKFTFSCWMGMISGVIEVIDSSS